MTVRRQPRRDQGPWTGVDRGRASTLPPSFTAAGPSTVRNLTKGPGDGQGERQRMARDESARGDHRCPRVSAATRSSASSTRRSVITRRLPSKASTPGRTAPPLMPARHRRCPSLQLPLALSCVGPRPSTTPSSSVARLRIVLLEDPPKDRTDLALPARPRPRDPGCSRNPPLGGRDAEKALPTEATLVHRLALSGINGDMHIVRAHHAHDRTRLVRLAADLWGPHATTRRAACSGANGAGRDVASRQ